MRTRVKLLLAGALVAAVIATSGCAIRREPIPNAGRSTTTTETASLEGATEARVRISMGAGKLSIEGEKLDADLMRGTFTYAPDSLEPIVETDKSGDRLDLTLRHPSDFGIDLGRNIESRWDVSLAEGVPTDLEVKLGAGESDLDLSGLDLSDLDIDMGAGDQTIDLSGPRTRDLSGKVTAGAGEVTIRLPKDIGVRVFGRKDGVGDWRYDGFKTDGDYLVNDAYGNAETSIDLDVQRGVGRVTLELAD